MSPAPRCAVQSRGHAPFTDKRSFHPHGSFHATLMRLEGFCQNPEASGGGGGGGSGGRDLHRGTHRRAHDPSSPGAPRGSAGSPWAGAITRPVPPVLSWCERSSSGLSNWNLLEMRSRDGPQPQSATCVDVVRSGQGGLSSLPPPGRGRRGGRSRPGSVGYNVSGRPGDLQASFLSQFPSSSPFAPRCIWALKEARRGGLATSHGLGLARPRSLAWLCPSLRPMEPQVPWTRARQPGPLTPRHPRPQQRIRAPLSVGLKGRPTNESRGKRGASACQRSWRLCSG